MHRSTAFIQLLKHCSKPGSLGVNYARLLSSSSSGHGATQTGVEITKAHWTRAALAAFAVTSAGVGYTVISSSSSDTDASAAQCHGLNVRGLPEYDKEEVAKHKTKDDRVWVTYKDGVYDVTEWIDQHPGGSVRVMMAAGGAIDPYWAMYAQHNTEQVRTILEGYRIGRLKGGAPPVENPYANEPKDRLAALQVRSKQPMNAETPLEFLSDSLITPSELFYIRNHLPVPEVDLKNYKLQIGGEGLRELTFTLEDLKTKFKKHSITAVLQCTGNRRVDLQKDPGAKEIKGLAWEGAAIGNAVWSGVLLKDVLNAAGLENTTSDPSVQHIQFEGLDQDTTGSVYGASIPISKALDPRGDVLLAYEMNGEHLNRDHGAPLRVVVPGVAACRSVKWLSKIIASPEESRSFWQREDYKSFSPSVDWDTVDWDSAPAIQNMPVTSQICYPSDGSTVDVIGGAVTVKGYAWSGGGNGIIRVDVSSDNGKNWTTAELKKVPQEVNRGWAWTLWEAEVPLPEKYEKGTQVTITAKAVDESYNTQPERADAIWNLRGVCCNTWPKVLITPEE
ncbi:hypothetical protein Ndes2526B_g05201 [Nannochloris sp. 'desiccata']|nr:hypothetical protein KSW81_000124 [Chlorella desiccata (nom. nud.)]KAH7619955.1 putative Sulfite oxidase, mitochondrial [Chlorella desiccata (nom. nud.)]